VDQANAKHRCGPYNIGLYLLLKCANMQAVPQRVFARNLS